MNTCTALKRWFVAPTAAALLCASVVPLPAAAQTESYSRCDLGGGDCFGVKWKDATVSEVAAVDVSAVDPEGVRPIHVASAVNGNVAVIDALLRRGSNAGLRTRNGLTPIHMAAFSNPNANVIKLLAQQGGDVRARTEQGLSALHIAARNNTSAQVMRALIQIGGDVEARTAAGYTPLHLAIAETRNPTVVRVLLDAGANVRAMAEVEDKAVTPLSLLNSNENLQNTDVYWEVRDAGYK